MGPARGVAPCGMAGIPCRRRFEAAEEPSAIDHLRWRRRCHAPGLLDVLQLGGNLNITFVVLSEYLYLNCV